MITVGAYMTPAPFTVGVEQSLVTARELMHKNHVRHLPVLHGGQLVGVLSERQVESFETLPGSSRLTVEEAMVPDVYVTSEGTPLRLVAEEMARLRVGSAVILSGSAVVGVFTSVDAMKALADALSPPPAATAA